VGGDKDAHKLPEGKNLDKNATSPKPTHKAITKLSYKQKYALEQLPGEMRELETLIADSKKLLSDTSLFTEDPELFNKTAMALEKAETRLEEAEAEWLELEILREELEG
jgi:ATP-binding cassette subfamily F protein uup